MSTTRIDPRPVVNACPTTRSHHGSGSGRGSRGGVERVFLTAYQYGRPPRGSRCTKTVDRTPGRTSSYLVASRGSWLDVRSEDRDLAWSHKDIDPAGDLIPGRYASVGITSAVRLFGVRKPRRESSKIESQRATSISPVWIRRETYKATWDSGHSEERHLCSSNPTRHTPGLSNDVIFLSGKNFRDDPKVFTVRMMARFDDGGRASFDVETKQPVLACKASDGQSSRSARIYLSFIAVCVKLQDEYPDGVTKRSVPAYGLAQDIRPKPKQVRPALA
ncbi:hypothetical protein JHW43_006440 [Diplocarpon mali]|nr:hypothetical protein JHW43_006440 [Diplocarpon mali]